MDKRKKIILVVAVLAVLLVGYLVADDFLGIGIEEPIDYLVDAHLILLHALGQREVSVGAARHGDHRVLSSGMKGEYG